MSDEYDRLLMDLETNKTQAQMADEQETEDRRDALRSRVYTIGQLVEQETEHAEPLLGPLVRRGMTTVIGGYGGAGKSTMSLEMVKAIVTGDEFLGYDGEGDCTAFIIDLEQGMSVAQRRIYEAFVGKPTHGRPLMELIHENVGLMTGVWEHVHYADWQEGVDLSNPGPGIDVVREVLAERRPDVVMIDPVYKLFMGTDLNEQVAISSFVREIQKLRTEFGFGLILPMHPRKPGLKPTGLTMHDLYGSAVWSWWAETILMVKRKGDESRLGFEKDRLSEGPPPGTDWDLEYQVGRGFRRASGDVDKGSDSNARRRIWDYLQDPMNRGHFFSRKDLATKLGIPADTVKKATEKMAAKANTGLYLHLECDKDGMENIYAYRPPLQPKLPSDEEEW